MECKLDQLTQGKREVNPVDTYNSCLTLANEKLSAGDAESAAIWEMAAVGIYKKYKSRIGVPYGKIAWPEEK